MSIPLYSGIVHAAAPAIINLINLGGIGMAFTDISVSGVNFSAAAPGTVQIEADIEAQYNDPSFGATTLPFHQMNWFGLATAVGQITNNIQLGPNQWTRSFPSPLIMPSSSLINLNVSLLVNCSGLNFAVDISGFTFSV